MAAMSSFVFEIFACDVVSIGSRKIVTIKNKYLTLSSLLHEIPDRFVLVERSNRAQPVTHVQAMQNCSLCQVQGASKLLRILTELFEVSIKHVPPPEETAAYSFIAVRD